MATEPAVSNPLLLAALSYAERGWKVFPCWWPSGDGCACSKGLACQRVGKHPLARLAPNGLLDATSDPAIIRGWWTQYPSANIGIRTGPESGFWVLDVDAYKGGAVSLEILEDTNRPLPQSLRARTGSGGDSTHICFAWPVGVEVRSRPVAGMRGLDVKGVGGYVIGAPSLHRSGGGYVWLDEDGSVLEGAPGWLLALVASAPAKEPTAPLPNGLELPDEDAAEFCTEWFARACRKIDKGEARHDTAVWLWVQFKDNGVPLAVAESWIDPYLDVAKEAGDRTVSDEEVRRICAWAYSKARRDPLPEVARRLGLAAAAEEAEEDAGPTPEEGGAAPGPPPEPEAAAPRAAAPRPYPWYDLTALRGEMTTIRRTMRPTGIPALDAALGGGLPGGAVITFVGPPGSCKSVLAIQLGLRRARDTGGVLYVYSPDQGGSQPLSRLAETFGDVVDDDGAFSRWLVELGPVIRVADEREKGVTLESFAAAIEAAGDAAAVVIDTPQTVVTDADDEGERARIDAAMDMTRIIASKNLIPVMVPNHANRSATAAKKKEDRSHPRAAALGSAKVEHRAQVQLFLEKVDRDDGRTEISVQITKALKGAGATFSLLLDPVSWMLREVDVAEAAADEDAMASIARDKRVRGWAKKIADVLRKHGPQPRSAVRTLTNLNGSSLAAAMEAMESAGTLRLEVVKGRGNPVILHLAGAGIAS